jgi:hypothetical protein
MLKTKKYKGGRIIVGQSLDVWGDKKQARRDKIATYLIGAFVIALWTIELVEVSKIIWK